MFKLKRQATMANVSNNETIIAQGVRVDGDFRSQGDVIIDGEVAGSVETQGALRVGETAKIHADVKAARAVIAGEVQGNIVVQEMLELLTSSRVKGDIATGKISVAAGARVNGRITMEEPGAHPRARKTTQEETVEAKKDES